MRIAWELPLRTGKTWPCARRAPQKRGWRRVSDRWQYPLSCRVPTGAPARGMNPASLRAFGRRGRRRRRAGSCGGGGRKCRGMCGLGGGGLLSPGCGGWLAGMGVSVGGRVFIVANPGRAPAATSFRVGRNPGMTYRLSVLDPMGEIVGRSGACVTARSAPERGARPAGGLTAGRPLHPMASCATLCGIWVG